MTNTQREFSDQMTRDQAKAMTPLATAPVERPPLSTIGGKVLDALNAAPGLTAKLEHYSGVGGDPSRQTVELRVFDGGGPYPLIVLPVEG